MNEAINIIREFLGLEKINFLELEMYKNGGIKLKGEISEEFLKDGFVTLIKEVPHFKNAILNALDEVE